MITKKTKLTMRNNLAMLVLSAGVMAAVLSGCANGGEPAVSQASNNPVASRVESAENSGEHGAGREGSETGGEHGNGVEGSESGSATGGEESGNALTLTETFDAVRGGARLIMNYDSAGNAFIGTVENTTGNTLPQVRVEVHLSNGTELGPTTPVDLAPGETIDVALAASGAAFDGWTPHAEVGSNEHGTAGEGSELNESGGEGGEVANEASGHPEGGEGSDESGDPSSPILALNESWDGVVNGVRTAMSFDPATGSFSGIVENTTNQTLCSAQIELNLKQGTTTVVELGPQPVGDLTPGAQTTVKLLVADEPEAAGVTFDAWEIHPEVFACDGSAPVDTEAGGAEGGNEVGGEQHSESGSENGNEGGEGGSESGGEHGSGGEGGDN